MPLKWDESMAGFRSKLFYTKCFHTWEIFLWIHANRNHISLCVCWRDFKVQLVVEYHYIIIIIIPHIWNTARHTHTHNSLTPGHTVPLNLRIESWRSNRYFSASRPWTWVSLRVHTQENWHKHLEDDMFLLLQKDWSAPWSYRIRRIKLYTVNYTYRRF